jgi:hypothetical protein
LRFTHKRAFALGKTRAFGLAVTNSDLIACAAVRACCPRDLTATPRTHHVIATIGRAGGVVSAAAPGQNIRRCCKNKHP